MAHTKASLLSLLFCLATNAEHLVYEGTAGPGKGKQLVFIAADHEYRSEETLPALARLLARHHGFKCTVLFSVDRRTGEIVPGNSNIPGMDALKAAETKAPEPAWARQLSADAQDSLAEERRLHEQVFTTHGMSEADAASTASAPNAVAYANFLLATAHAASFEEAIAALLPCYWIYWEVGKALQAEGSPNATYQTWIDAYVSPGYADAVGAIVDMVNAASAGADAATRERMHERFRRSSRYEWMVWDAAYRRQTWPPE